jgi:phosphatidate cytidylyltransferase
MLWWRTATAFVLAPVALGAILVGKWAVLALACVVVGVAAYELSQALKPLPFVAALGAGALPILLSIPYGRTGILAGAMLSLPWALLWLAGKPEIRTLRAVLAVLLMALWVGVPLAHLGLFPRSRYGEILVLIAVVGPWFPTPAPTSPVTSSDVACSSRASARTRPSRVAWAACS